ncbi:hypothetical protein QFC21_005744 [Naganishia friedmannii]|uniref:Uncharacterized protein n=1 Tax=Naganishia friedmannii TaxID=89922 RepID=A0ACC2V8R7_9TREE|nr:hypothetical protein QFC21_005744 [Naganishia friedmannii]
MSYDYSYFTQAEQVASLLGIRLTSKAFGGAATTPSRKSSGTPTPPAKHFPFAGFPIHQKDKYFQLLLDQGRSFVVVEEEAVGYSDQRETSDDAPRMSKEQKVRYVARRYTAGTLCNESWQVDGGDNRYLLGISFGGNDGPLGQEEAELGLAYIDISTDRAVATRLITLDELEHELTRVSPVEIVLDRSIEALMSSHSIKEDGMGKAVTLLKALLKGSDIALSYVDPRHIDDRVSPLSALEASATRLVNTHLSACLMDGMPQLLAPHHREARTTMQIDASTLLGLEVRHSLRSNAHSNNRVPPTMWSSPVSRSGTLLSVIKRTLTSSGTRLLVNTLTQPSAHLPTITHRHALVHAFVERSRLREDLRDFLRAQSARGRIGAGTGSHGEIVRIVQKFSAARRRSPSGPGRVAKHYGGPTAAMGNARDLMDLREKIQGIRWIVERIREEVDRDTSTRWTDRTERLRTLVAQHEDLSSLVELIDGAVQRGAIEAADETEDELTNPGKTRGVWWLRPDYNDALQALLGQAQDLETQRLAMEADLQTEFNTPLLELKTSPFAPGLFVYVPIKKGNAGLVEQDDRLIPLRTNKTAKTYLFGPWTVLGLQIQEIHDKIATAQEEAFDDLREQILTRQNELLINAGLLDEIDLTLGFAQAADELRWVRPEMQEEPVLDIVNGRHPTVEYSLMTSSSSPRPFIPNDLHIHSSAPVHIITGPNMGGKSTMLRQTAILSILAQSGSFVPADTARIGVVDAVFSRVGARDDLYRDMSTFMLEMHETAYILTHATRQSLVIMDEIGRGTTYKSGLAIAYATLDHILRHIGCRTLFATHYHEVCDMLSEEQGFARPGQKVESSDVSNSSVSADAAAGQRSRDVEFWYTDLDESVSN